MSRSWLIVAIVVGVVLAPFAVLGMGPIIAAVVARTGSVVSGLVILGSIPLLLYGAHDEREADGWPWRRCRLVQRLPSAPQAGDKEDACAVDPSAALDVIAMNRTPRHSIAFGGR